MSRRRPDRFRPRVDFLDPRILLAGINAVWIGQTNVDKTSVASNSTSNDYVDAEIDISNLSVNSSQVTCIKLRQNGGGYSQQYGAVPGEAFVNPLLRHRAKISYRISIVFLGGVHNSIHRGRRGV